MNLIANIDPIEHISIGDDEIAGIGKAIEQDSAMSSAGDKIRVSFENQVGIGFCPSDFLQQGKIGFQMWTAEGNRGVGLDLARNQNDFSAIDQGTVELHRTSLQIVLAEALLSEDLDEGPSPGEVLT